MKSLIEILTLSTEYLLKRGIENPRKQAEEILCDVLAIDRLKLYMDFDRPLHDEELNVCRKKLSRRAKGEPLQYIRGEVDFYHCSFLVNPAVLIPRNETEILVEKVVRHLEKCDLRAKSLWDVCCGSGCIGISLKKKFPELQVTLSDFSKDSLDLAAKNAERNQVEVEFLLGDFLKPFANRKTDFLICNPPYIAQSEYEKLEREVKDFEPRHALVAGVKGTEYYERLSEELPPYLYPSAKVWLEIGFDQGNCVQQLFNQPLWKAQRLEKDWAGHDRFFSFERG